MTRPGLIDPAKLHNANVPLANGCDCNWVIIINIYLAEILMTYYIIFCPPASFPLATNQAANTFFAETIWKPRIVHHPFCV